MGRSGGLKVLHVYKGFSPPQVGGIERYLATLCAEVGDRVESTVLTSGSEPRTEVGAAPGATVVRLARMGSVAGIPVTPSLSWWLRRADADLVHLHFPSPMGELGWIAAGRRTPMVVSYHGDIVRQRRIGRIYGPVVRQVLDRAAAVVVGSQAMVETSAMLHRCRGRCEVIPYGVRLEEFALGPGEREDVEQLRTQLASDRALLCFVGRLVYYKSLPVLVDAMRDVDARLVLVGSGPMEAELRDQVDRLRLAERVTFVGRVPDRALVHYLHACDAFVFPSSNRAEAFGIAQVEAMACGKPVVSTQLDTGVSSVNRDGVTGLTVQPGDPKALAGALGELVADDVRRAELGRNARELAVSEYSASVMADRTLDLYERVLGAAR